MNHKLKRWILMVIVILVIALESHSVLAADYPDINAYDSTTTLKGVQGEQKYGSQHAFYNFDIRKCYIPDSYPECGLPYYEFEGKKYRFFDALNFFSWLSTQNYAGRTANVQFMISWEDNNDTYLWQDGYPLRRILIDPAVTAKVTGAYYYAPASTGEGRQIMRAFWSWFMTELSKRQLHIDNFILGNEVNAPLYWHYSVDGAWTEKVQKYATSFYDMRQIIRSFSDKPRISICLDHSWTHNDEGRAIPAISYLSFFDAKLTELNDSKIVDDWCISMHLYPAVLTWPLIWTDKPGYPPNLNALSASAYFVDGKNLSYITNYIKNTYGENHRIMLTEQGFTSHWGENVQAASLVYSYYAAKYDPMVDCFILMVADSGAELQFSIDGKLAGQIYPVIDDFSNQETVNATLLSTIGVTSWSQIVPNYGQTIERKAYVGSGSKYVIEVSSSVAEGGSVTGAGTYEKGHEVTLTATPSSNYVFVAWKEGDNVVSTNSTYTFTAEKKRTLVAEFLEKPWIAFEANGGGGSMSGLRVEFGTEYKLPECDFTAPDGMEFGGWEIGTEKHQLGEIITVSNNVTIKAVWKERALYNLVGASMSLGNELDMHFFVNKSDVKDANCYARITKTYANNTPDLVLTIPFSEWFDYNDKYFMINFDMLSAKEMNDAIYVQVFRSVEGSDDEPLSNQWKDSVADYVCRMFDKQNECGKRLFADMLNYGAAAQAYFDYDKGHPAYDILSDEQKEFATKTVSFTNSMHDSLNYKGANFELNNTILFNLYFEDSVPADGYAKISYENHRGEKVEYEVKGSDFVHYKEKYWQITIKGLAVPDVSQMVTCTIYAPDHETVYASVVDNMESYVARMTQSNPLYEAIMKFGVSSHRYFHQGETD